MSKRRGSSRPARSIGARRKTRPRTTGRDHKPKWDRQLRRLWVGDVLVKEFHQPAAAAQRILDAFEEEDWPWRIADPLPPLEGRLQAQRLRKQVYALNRRMTVRRIRFFLDGTGQGLCWELLPLGGPS